MKTLYKLLLSVMCIAAAGGCDRFLDVPPTSDVTIPATAEDYQDMLYSLTASYTADAMIGVMGDEVYWSEDFYAKHAYDNATRRGYLWQDEVYDITLQPTAWTYRYTNIYIYNKIIDEVGDVPGEPADKLKKIEAEARLYRAMNYFNLVNLFCIPYADATPEDPGVPVIEANDVMDFDRRQTPVREAYDFILADLDSAALYLPDYPQLRSRFLGSRVGALGYKARVLMQMQEYGKALDAALDALEIIETTPAPNGLTYKLLDYNTLALRDPEQPWLGMDGTRTFPRSSNQEEQNVESVLTSTLFMRDPTVGTVAGAPFNPIFVSDHLLSFFTAPGDLRALYMLHDRDASGNDWDANAPGLTLKRFNYSNCGVSMPELVLIAAECHARAGETEQALIRLNDLRRNRIETARYTELSSTDPQQILRWVLEERMREFIATGHRWLDIRRLWDDPVGSTMIEKTRRLGDQTYTLTRERLTVRIPEYVMQFHDDWKQNP